MTQTRQFRVARRGAAARAVAVDRSRVTRPALAAWSAVLLACLILLCAAPPAAGVDDRSLPSLNAIEKLVVERFGTDGRELTDLVTRQEVEPLLAEIKKAGWNVRDRKEILERAPDDSEFFVRQLLGSKKGIAFMRDIAAMPLGYDRVDRLSQMTLGHVYLRDMIKGPDGYKLIQYMTEAPGGIEMGRMLSEAPHGQDFNKPTGRIYSAEQLLGALAESYRAEAKRRAEAQASQGN